jgi:hypothetical protein
MIFSAPAGLDSEKLVPGGTCPHRRGIDAMSTPDQVPVPAEQGLGLPEGPPLTPTAKEPTQPGEQRSVSWSQVRSGHLTTEVGNLMVEHDDFGPQFFVVASSQAVQLDDSDKGKAEQREGRGPVFCNVQLHESPMQNTRMGFSALTGRRQAALATFGKRRWVLSRGRATRSRYWCPSGRCKCRPC